jgi:uncharacterized membrane protein YqjE
MAADAATPPPARSAGVKLPKLPKLVDAVRTLRPAGAALVVQALLHGQLIRIEWQEEKIRLLKMLVIALCGFACLLCAMLFAGGFVLAASWETPYWLLALVGMPLLFSAGAAAAWWRFQAWSAQSDRAFAASGEELAADAALLKTIL